MPERTTISLVAGINSSGELVREEVLVDRTGNTEYRIVATPGLVLGIARGDVLSWVGGDAKPQMLERGGFIGLQIHGAHEVADLLRDDVSEMGEYLDGRARNLTIYSIPATAGFDRIEVAAA